jgi:hypothetical protein
MMAESKNDWNQRILCSDGNCIGIIGADGRCTECGRPYDGERPLPVAEPAAADEGADASPADRQITAETDRVSADSVLDTQSTAGENDDVWEKRTLCVDESCIGVVGPDGRCKECGKPYPG